MSQTRGAVQTIARSAPDIAALILTIPTLAYVAFILPRSGCTTGPTSCPDLTSRTGSTRWTNARVARDAVYAGGTSGARIARAFIHVNTTIRASKPGRAFASEPIVTVHTFATVETWHWLTIVHITPAIRSFKAFATDASIAAINRIDAGCTICARITRTRRWRCDMADCAFPSARAVACKTVTVILAIAAVTTSVFIAVAAAQSACLALPIALADACEICHAVYTGTIVVARLCQAVIHI